MRFGVPSGWARQGFGRPTGAGKHRGDDFEGLPAWIAAGYTVLLEDQVARIGEVYGMAAEPVLSDDKAGLHA